MSAPQIGSNKFVICLASFCSALESTWKWYHLFLVLTLSSARQMLECFESELAPSELPLALVAYQAAFIEWLSCCCCICWPLTVNKSELECFSLTFVEGKLLRKFNWKLCLKKLKVEKVKTLIEEQFSGCEIQLRFKSDNNSWLKFLYFQVALLLLSLCQQTLEDR